MSAGVATPWHAEIFTPQELQRAVIARGRDLVLKPVEKLGPATELRLIEVEDLAAAFQQARAASPSERVMVELVKDPVLVPGFLLAGRCTWRANETARALVERAALGAGHQRWTGRGGNRDGRWRTAAGGIGATAVARMASSWMRRSRWPVATACRPAI